MSAKFEYDVFLSHSMKDKEVVHRLAKRLSDSGLRVWLDDWIIKPGNDIYLTIENGLEKSRTLILFISQASLTSEWVKLERSTALFRDPINTQRRFIPLLLDNCNDKIPDTLRRYKYLDWREEDDRVFEKILEACRSEIECITESALTSKSSHPISSTRSIGRLPSNLPFDTLGDLFKGRNEELAKLEIQFHQSNPAVTTQHLVITGMGGIGKTRLALEFAFRHSLKYKSLLFISSNSSNDIDVNLARLSAPMILDLPEYKSGMQEEQKSSVIRWLQQNDGWLLILDNADTPDAGLAIQNMLANLRNGHVIITSRLTNWPRNIHRLPIDVLPVESAVQLLMESTEGERITRNDDEIVSKAIVQKLGCLPLAMIQATAYINYLKYGFSEYLVEFENNFEEILHYHDPVAIEYDAEVSRSATLKTIATTFFMSFDKLGSVEKTILRMSSFLAAEPIPSDIFGKNPEKLEMLVKLWEEETGDNVTKKSPKIALAELAKFSLITQQGETFTVHRMVQQVLRAHTPGDFQPRWLDNIIRLFCHYAERPSLKPDNRLLWNILLPHAECLYERSSQIEGAEKSRTLIDFIAQDYEERGNWEQAIAKARTSLELHVKQLGPEHPETLSTTHFIVHNLWKNGELEEAEQLNYKIIESRERVLGIEHKDTIGSKHDLACILLSKGDYSSAEQKFTEVLELYEKILEPHHNYILTCLNDLAVLLGYRDEYEKAEVLLRRSIEGYENYHEPDHPGKLRAIGNLGFLMLKIGNYDEAEPLIRQSAIDRERVLGEEHPDALSSLKNLIELLDAKNQPEEAKVLREIYNERILRRGSDADLESMRTLALQFYLDGTYLKAEKILHRLLEKKFELPSTHCHLARLYMLTDREKEARYHVGQAWKSRNLAPPYMIPRIHFFNLIFAMLDGDNPIVHVNQVNQALNQEGANMKWTIQPLIDHLKTRLKQDDFALLQEMADAINDKD